METNEIAKATSLLGSIILCCLALSDIEDWSTVGIFIGCGLEGRLLYPFYHANLLHAALNIWCLLAVVFIYDISIWRLCCAYAIAISIPTFCLSVIPTVGISGILFALFGSISFEVERKGYYQLLMIAYIIIGFLFPNTNAWIHLYCYLAGCMVALLNKPIKVG